MKRVSIVSVLLAFLLCVLASCARVAPPPPPKVAKTTVGTPPALTTSTAPTDEDLDPDVGAADEAESAAADVQTNGSLQNDSSGEGAEPANEEGHSDDAAPDTIEQPANNTSPNGSAALEAEAESRVPADRVMLLTPSGPLLVDLHIKIGGKPYRESFESVVSDVMAIADDDKDGLVSWDDLMNHPRFSAGQFGNPPTASYQAQRDMVRQYDTTKNDRVDPDELIRYLTRNQSSSQALALYTSNYRRMQNRDDSPVRKWLDANDDLVLDDEEIASAGRRLRLRDTNDDDILFPSDFDDSLNTNGMMARRRPRDSEYLPKVGWTIRQDEPWSDMRVAWNHFYSVGQDVRADDLVIGDEMFKQLDLDQNDQLDNIEMEMLAEVDAHISLEIDLGTKEAQAEPNIELTALRLPTEELNGVIQHQPNRITVELPAVTLDLFASDRIGYEGYDEQAMQLLERGDGDSNGYLSQEEFDAVGGGPLDVDFDAVDFDNNDMVFQDEIVMLLEQRNIVNRNQIDVRADDQDDALFPSLDLNSDGRLDSREISRVTDVLHSLDDNEDGEIHLHELRGSMMLGVVRGGGRGQIVRGDDRFNVPAVSRKPSDSTPRWFTGMDRNRDGGISWREFLGTRLQFEELDTDRDGFVVEEEAVRP